MRERNQLASRLDGVRKLEVEVADTLELIALAEADGDGAMVVDGIAALRAVAQEAKRREIESLLSGEADSNDCYIEINAGAGGTEAQDWAEMLMRMYTRWAEQRGYKVQLLDEGEGEQAGIKSGDASSQRPKCVWLAEDRGRGASAGTHQPVRCGGAAADQLRQRLGLSGGGREHRYRDQGRGSRKWTPTGPPVPAGST